MRRLAHARSRPRVDGHDESGTSLLLALLFITVTSVMIVMLLTMSFTASRANNAFRQQRVVRYNAESAMNITIERLRHDPLLGTVADDCNGRFKMRQLLGTTNRHAIDNGSYLTVKCGPTPNSPFGDPALPDADGGQKPRDVTITIVCNEVPSFKPLFCLDTYAGGNERVVARARVRFEPNYALTDTTKRSVVPKIVSWDTEE